MSIVIEVLDAIKNQGLKAALEYTRIFDKVDLDPSDVIWNPMDLDPLVPAPEQKEAIDFAIEQIARFHQETRPTDISVEQAPGLTLTETFVPLDRVGVYVPNGGYPLLSSLFMSAVPAQVAGVQDIVVAIPPRGNIRQNALWLYSLQTLGITTAVSLGGAQAIGLLGYGSAELKPVDLIAGPGNRFVAEAKQELFRRSVTGIDLVAGPSEVLVIAERVQDAEVSAMDLMAQAEHAPDAKSYFVTWNPDLMDAVQTLVSQESANPAMGPIDYRLVNTPEEAAAIANHIAPEHLGLIGPMAESLLPHIRHAGAVFVGAYAGQALGDYVAGPSHVLPTAGTARYLSGLSTKTFMRRMSIIQAAPEMPASYLEHGQVLAALEGLEYHRRSLEARQKREGR